MTKQRSPGFFAGGADGWCTKADEKKLIAMGYDVGQDGAVNKQKPGRWQFIWAPHYYSDIWLEKRGYRRGFLADWGMSGAELDAGNAMVFEDPISAAIWLEVNSATG